MIHYKSSTFFYWKINKIIQNVLQNYYICNTFRKCEKVGGATWI